MKVGTLFGVTEYTEFRDGKQLVAKYHPGQPYKLTERNLKFVNGLVDHGIAGVWAGPAVAVGTVTGKVETTAEAAGDVKSEPAAGGN